MKKFKSVIAMILVIITVIGCFTMPASAKNSSSQKIVNWSAVNPNSASTNVKSYTIKGNALSQKKVTVVAASKNGNFNYDSKAISFYKNNARFRVDIYKNGVWQRAYTGTLGQYFKLPKGASNYKVVVQTYYSNWRSNNTCWTAAVGGYYYLKY